MEILVGNLVNKIKTIFDSTKVLSVESVNEEINNSNELRLVISMNKILYDDVNIIYTKILFVMDSNKTKLTKNYFSYLYDINCEYIRIYFNDLEDFSNKITKIFKENKFGDDIKILSKLSKSPSTLINTWFKNNKITDLSVTNFEVEKIPIVSCELLEFNFIIDLNNNQKGKLNISKKDKNKYVFKFEFLDNIYEDEETNLDHLVETIGNNLKNKIKM
ncbi:hypothetical protein M0Q97_05850 [Candidatus Dojkabacteria bacterium]|jgi:hypothetical protein|nr:hypothetical protein [Candidatus Dojkabacteria bacterium]